MRFKSKRQAQARKQEGQKAEGRGKQIVKRLLRWTGAVFLLFVILSVTQVLWVRFKDPQVTPLMKIRVWEAKWQGEEDPQVAYQWVEIGNAGRHFLHLAWVTEDTRFFRHFGFDLVEMRMALAEAWREGSAPRGASTITMQTARSVFLWQGRSWARKVLEAYYTVWMELLLPKERILELYVNVIETGDLVFGIEAAAQTYYGKSATELSREEAASIVAILPNPRGWNPVEPGERAAWRKEWILKKGKKVPFPEGVLQQTDREVQGATP